MKEKIALLGGDGREVILAETLAAADYEVHGFRLCKQAVGAISDKNLTDCLEDAEAIIFPVRGIDENGTLLTDNGEKIIIDERSFAAIPEDTHIFTGIASNYLKELCANCNLPLTAVMNHNDLAIANAVPTAEGILTIALNERKTILNGAKVTVCGFGRVGKAVARVFKGVGCKVCVLCRSVEDRQVAELWGMEAFGYDAKQQVLAESEIIINTVPALVITAEDLKAVPADILIYDLATKPGGVDFAAAGALGIKAKLCPGLPGIYFPQSAGEIIAQKYLVILDNLFKEKE